MKNLVTWMAVVIAAVGMPPIDALKVCRQSNYVTKNNKIYAVDPENTTATTEIHIKGVSWSGLENLDRLMLDGLFGTESPNNYGTSATTWSKLTSFLTNHTFNSVRIPLDASAIVANTPPNFNTVHQYENRDLTTNYPDRNNVLFMDFLMRVIQAFQDHGISILLDMHLDGRYAQDALWYTKPYTAIENTPTYKAITQLGQSLCNAGHWNVLGIEVKNEMMDVLWNAESADVQTDWQQAAQALANHIVRVCPQWLAFVGGASSPTPFQQFVVNARYAHNASHWDGGNLKNASVNPISMTTPNKLVYSPHAHAHGIKPQNYFFSTDSDCCLVGDDDGCEAPTNSAAKVNCLDIINGKKETSKATCSQTVFTCKAYTHLSAEDIKKNYKLVMDEALGNLQKDAKQPIILGSFSGVYSPLQPHQTAALDFLIDTAQSLSGGYYWALNPDSEFFLEDSTSRTSGVFERTHSGLFQMNSWQNPNNELLDALNRIASTPIPCYGGKATDSKAYRHGGNALVQMMMVAVWILMTMLCFN